MNSNISSQLRISKRNKKIKQLIKNSIIYLVLTLLGICLLFPFFFMLMKSLMTWNETVEVPLRFFPRVPQFKNYLRVADIGNEFVGYTGNTLKIVAFNLVATTLSCSLCGFAFAKCQWKGRGVVFSCMMATMMVPVFVVQIPQFVMFNDLDMVGTLWPLMLPSLFGGGAMNIFLMRQYMRGIPNTIDEAAKIDGANAFMRYLRIIMPLCKPVLVFVMIGSFIGNWSDFFGPLVYLTNSEKNYTLALGIYYKFIVAGAGNANAELRCAIAVVMAIPPAILFFIFQNQLIEGVTMGAIKG